MAFAAALGLDIGGDLDMLSGIVADQELDHTLARILHELKQHNIVLPDTWITRLKGLFQVFHANNQMTYGPEGPINAPITLFKASEFQAEVIDNEHFRQAIDDTAVLARIEAMNRTWAQFNDEVAKAREDAHLG